MTQVSSAPRLIGATSVTSFSAKAVANCSPAWRSTPCISRTANAERRSCGPSGALAGAAGAGSPRLPARAAECALITSFRMASVRSIGCFATTIILASSGAALELLDFLARMLGQFRQIDHGRGDFFGRGRVRLTDPGQLGDAAVDLADHHLLLLHRGRD